MTVKPTRSELQVLKGRIKLAKNGYELLKKKRDGLIMEFMELLKDLKDIRGEIVSEYTKALHKLNIARLLESDFKIESIAAAITSVPDIDMKSKNIMGVVVPSIGELKLQTSSLNRGHGVYNSAGIDEAATAFGHLIERIVRAAELETTMRRLLKEIEKTKRRVNALEFEVIPRMEKTKAFIQLRLEETERENTFRMKRIKKKNAN